MVLHRKYIRCLGNLGKPQVGAWRKPSKNAGMCWVVMGKPKLVLGKSKQESGMCRVNLTTQGSQRLGKPDNKQAGAWNT